MIRNSISDPPKKAPQDLLHLRIIADYIENLKLKLRLAEKTEGKRKLDIFCNEQEPKIGMFEYFQRMHKYIPCTPDVWIMVLIYVIRVGRILDMKAHSFHLVALCSFTVALKFHCDDEYSNVTLASIIM